MNNELLQSSPRALIHYVRIALLLILVIPNIQAQDTDISKLKTLSLEELMNIEVTSVNKHAELLSEAASAIQVLTHDDIVRSGATNIPEALRLAPNLQVSQVNSSAWIIGARGFNTVFANKLLVLIDGRSVYTPLFGGVLWELQSVMLEDVDRIEIITGPGATLWGANAVNGVINIITRKAEDTQGVYASAAAGNFLNRTFQARYGSKMGAKTFYKVFAQTSDRDATRLATRANDNDSWRNSQAGFRMGSQVDDHNYINVQGEAYIGTKFNQPSSASFDGQNILARWTRTGNDNSELTVQTYYDRYWRDDAGTADQLSTFDIDAQYRTPFGKKQTLMIGGGYRYVRDEVTNRTDFAGLVPANRSMPIYSGFVQDEIFIETKLKLTLGAKVLHNIFSGFEVQPSARIAWNVKPSSTLWAAASRAIRAPSRFDVDYRLPIAPQPPTVPSVVGATSFDSEKLHALELGFRTQPANQVSLSLATFYNMYDDLYSVEVIPGTQTFLIQNGSMGETWGGEFSGLYQVNKRWRLRGGFTYFSKDLRAKAGHVNDPSYLANDAKHHAVLQSILDLPAHFTFDVVGRYLDYLPASFATVRVPEYVTFDVRIGYSFKNIELSAIGQNLQSDYHTEFGTQEIPRSFYGKVAWRF